MGRKSNHAKRYQNVGRPTKLTDAIVGKLEEAAELDCTIEEMATHAGIHRDTLYDWLNKNPELSDRLESLRNKPIITARKSVIGGLASPSFALGYLEKKRKVEFGIETTVNINGNLGIHAEPSVLQKQIVDKFEDELRKTFVEAPKTALPPAPVIDITPTTQFAVADKRVKEVEETAK